MLPYLSRAMGTFLLFRSSFDSMDLCSLLRSPLVVSAFPLNYSFLNSLRYLSLSLNCSFFLLQLNSMMNPL